MVTKEYLQKLTRPELSQYCRNHGIKGYSGKTKADRITLILNVEKSAKKRRDSYYLRSGDVPIEEDYQRQIKEKLVKQPAKKYLTWKEIRAKDPRKKLLNVDDVEKDYQSFKKMSKEELEEIYSRSHMVYSKDEHISKGSLISFILDDIYSVDLLDQWRKPVKKQSKRIISKVKFTSKPTWVAIKKDVEKLLEELGVQKGYEKSVGKLKGGRHLVMTTQEGYRIKKEVLTGDIWITVDKIYNQDIVDKLVKKLKNRYPGWSISSGTFGFEIIEKRT